MVSSPCQLPRISSTTIRWFTASAGRPNARIAHAHHAATNHRATTPLFSFVYGTQTSLSLSLSFLSAAVTLFSVSEPFFVFVPFTLSGTGRSIAPVQVSAESGGENDDPVLPGSPVRPAMMGPETSGAGSLLSAKPLTGDAVHLPA